VAGNVVTLSAGGFGGDNNLALDATMNGPTILAVDSVGGASYVYDPLGQRVGKQGVGLTDTVYFGGKPIARYSAGQWTDLIYGPTGLLAEVPGTQNGAPVYRVTDHLGSTVGSLLADGSLVNPVDYTPFGQVFSGGTSDPYLFTGYERDAESGFDYASARHFASNTGRFLSPDPSGLAYADLTNPQSFNLYSYALNNPLKYVDPTGLDECQWDGGDQTDPEDNLNTKSSCEAAGGNWFGNTDTQVTVRANGDSDCSGDCDDDSHLTADDNSGAAPNSQTSASHCLGQALNANGVSLALDAASIGVGFIPGGNTAVGAVKVFATVGVGAASTGYSAGTSTSFGVGAVKFASGTAGTLFSAVGILDKMTAGAQAVSFVPILGNISTAISTATDLYKTYQTFSTCRAGG